MDAGNTVIWVPLAQKAWAKVVGSYAQYAADTTTLQAGIRTLAGVPVINHDMASITSDSLMIQLWNTLALAKTLGYIMTAEVGGSTPATQNTCQLYETETFSILGTFTTSYNGVADQLILMRNTRGPAKYQGNWGKTDYTRWTIENKAKVPFGLDLTHANVYNLGLFALPMTELQNAKCIKYLAIGQYRAGYSSDRYDAEWDYSNAADKKYNPDIGLNPVFSFTPTYRSGDIYINVDTYPVGAVPETCSSGTYTNAKYSTLDGARQRPIIYFAVYSGGEVLTGVPTYGYKLY